MARLIYREPGLRCRWIQSTSRGGPMSRVHLLLLSVLVLGGTQPFAQQGAAGQNQEPRADTAKPESLVLSTAETLEFTTDEVTWPSVDVSPDGRTLVFDVLGDLYTLPID